MKKTLILLFVVLSFELISINGEKAAKEKDTAEAPVPTPAAENVICKRCNCDAKMKIIECSNKGLSKMFTEEEWAGLNSTKDDYEVLKLDHNNFEKIDLAFPALRFPLKVIDFRHNKIKEIVKNVFTNLDYLEEVNLAYNQLTTEKLKPEVFEGKYSPDEYEPLLSLKKLVLSFNLLHNLDPELFEHTKHLQELYLDNNPFQIVHTNVLQAFGDLSQLQKLDMSRMELSSLPEDVFHPLRALKVLKLEGNIFKTIPTALKYAINVRELSLDENPIGDLSETYNMFPVMTKLEKLNMTFMGSLYVIGKGSMGGLESLKELHLSHNHHLSYIHPNAFSFPMKDNSDTQWPVIERLSLNNNNLSTIDSQMFRHWTEMEEVHLHDNPWLCDCKIEWVLKELMPVINKTTPHLIDHTKCAEPQPMLGMKLLELSDGTHAELRCLDKFGAHPERDSALLVALLIGVLLGMPLAYASILIYKRSCNRRGPADFSRAFYKRADLQDDVHI